LRQCRNQARPRCIRIANGSKSKQANSKHTGTGRVYLGMMHPQRHITLPALMSSKKTAYEPSINTAPAIPHRLMPQITVTLYDKALACNLPSVSTACGFSPQREDVNQNVFCKLPNRFHRHHAQKPDKPKIL